MAKYLFSFLYQTSRKGFLLAKRILIVFFVFSAVITLFTHFIQKNRIEYQISTVEQSRTRIYENIETMNQDQSTEGQVKTTVYRGVLCSMSGEACSDDPNDAQENYQKSVLGTMTSWMSSPYSHPPASGLVWVQDSLQKTGLIPDTYAATGLGFASIQSYSTIWKLFRDIAYLVMVLILIAIGFMIMFRVNAGGQTAVGIENALPRIVIAMIMITFSFPIAGFLIDMMYSMIAISVGLLYDVGLEHSVSSNFLLGAPSSKEYLNDYLTAGFNELWPDGGGSFFSVGISLWRLMPNTVQTLFHSAFVLPLAATLAEKLGFITDQTTSLFKMFSVAGFSTGNFAGIPYVAYLIFIFTLLVIWGPGLIFGAIIMLTVLFFMFRIFFMLLGSYIKIILYIIFSPIILMLSALPGNGNIGWWLKNLIAELITFPTVIIITLVGNAIMAVNNPEMDHPFGHLLGGSAGLETSFRLPFLYGFQTDDFNTIIALGLVLMIPDFVKMVKGWIGVSDSPLKFDVSTFFAGAGVFTGAFGMAQGFEGFRNSVVGYDPAKPRKGLLSPLGLDKKLQGIPGIGQFFQ